MKKNQTVNTQGGKMLVKGKSAESIYSFAILVFSLIAVCIVLQMAFLA